MLSAKIIQAFEFAFLAHQKSVRKQGNIPYIVHPLDVISILMKHEASEELIMAGLLHDVIEDEGITLENIREKFGGRVAFLVNEVTEPMELVTSKEGRKATWEKRKAHTINKMKNAEYDVKLLSCADKLSNIRDTVINYKIQGDKVWDRFNATKEKQQWYFTEMCKSFAFENSIAGTRMYQEFVDAVNILFP